MHDIQLKRMYRVTFPCSLDRNQRLRLPQIKDHRGGFPLLKPYLKKQKEPDRLQTSHLVSGSQWHLAKT